MITNIIDKLSSDLDDLKKEGLYSIIIGPENIHLNKKGL